MNDRSSSFERNAIVAIGLSLGLGISVFIPWENLTYNRLSETRFNAFEPMMSPAASWWPRGVTSGVVLLILAAIAMVSAVGALISQDPVLERFPPLVTSGCGFLALAITYFTRQHWHESFRSTSIAGFWIAVASSIGLGLSGLGWFAIYEEERRKARRDWLRKRAQERELRSRPASGRPEIQFEVGLDPVRENPKTNGERLVPSVNDRETSRLGPRAQGHLSVPRSKSTSDTSDRSWVKKYVGINAVLIVLVPLSLLLPMFRLSAFGFSGTVNAFSRQEDSSEVDFWLTKLPVGWLVLLLAIVTLGLLLWSTKASRESPQPAIQVILAASGILIAVLLLATWWFANHQLDVAISKGVAELKADGNPFSELAQAMNGVTLTPDFGYWVAVVLAIASAGAGVSGTWWAKQPEPRTSHAVNSVERVEYSVSNPTEQIALIKEIAALRDEGVLTDQEFEDQKRKILGRGE